MKEGKIHTKCMPPRGIQRNYFCGHLIYIYPRHLLRYTDATFDLTDLHNGIYLVNMVCHNFCQCLFSQIYNISKVQAIPSDDCNISTQTEYTFK